MKSALIALALLAAITNGQYIENGIVSVESDYYDLAIDLMADIGYMTTYKAGEGLTGGMTAASGIFETYGLTFYSVIALTIAENIADVYTNTAILYFYPFKVEAINVRVGVSRVDQSEPVQLGISLDRDIAVGYWYTRWIENAITCAFSIVDYLAMDPPPEELMDAVWCGYNPVFEEDYLDPIWTYNIGGDLLMFDSTANTGWYGAQNYWGTFYG